MVPVSPSPQRAVSLLLLKIRTMLIKCHLSLPSDHLRCNLICKAALKLLFDYFFVGIFVGSEKDEQHICLWKRQPSGFLSFGNVSPVVLNSVF